MTITIEMDVVDYIDLLDQRRAEVEKNFGWTIPDGVYDYFCEMLEDGCGINPDNANPRYVIDNMVVNGDYGPIENYGLLDEFLDHAREKFAEEYADGNYDICELNDFIEENKEELIDGSGIRDELFFTYDDKDSEYGIGVCYSL